MDWSAILTAGAIWLMAIVSLLVVVHVLQKLAVIQQRPEAPPCPFADDDPDDCVDVEHLPGDGDDTWLDDPDWWKRERNGTAEE